MGKDGAWLLRQAVLPRHATSEISAKPKRGAVHERRAGPDVAVPRHPPEPTRRQGPRVRARAVSHRPEERRRRQHGPTDPSPVASASLHRGLAGRGVRDPRQSAEPTPDVQPGAGGPRRDTLRRRISGGKRQGRPHRADRNAGRTTPACRTASRSWASAARSSSGSRRPPSVAARPPATAPASAASPCPGERRPGDRRPGDRRPGDRHNDPHPRHAPRSPRHAPARATAASISTAPSAAAATPPRLLQSAACTVWAIDRDPEAIARGATLCRPLPRPAASHRGPVRRHARPAARSRRADAGRRGARSRRVVLPARRSRARVLVPRRRPARHAHGQSTARPRPTW